MPTIKSYNKRLEALRSERSSFIPLWRELSDFHLAHRGRFLTSDRNKGFKRNTKQYNNKSRLASRTLASGMMAGITSPARPWFRLSAPTPELNDVAAVKEWLHDVQVTMYRVFAQSNVYNSLHMLYAEMGVFGTAAMGVFEDFDHVIWCRPYTIGSYMIGVDGRNQVDTFYREYEISVAQCVKQYGYENCSDSVQQQWGKGNTENWIKVVHVTEPNDDRDMNSPMSRDKQFRSVHYEWAKGVGKGTDKDDKFLRRSGFDDYPILTPRWDLAGDDIYATDSPGMIAIGDTKALQLGEKRKYQALDKLVNPPLQGPPAMKNKISNGSINAGDLIYTDANGAGFKSIYDFRPDLNAMVAINQESERRISAAFYEDLFLMLANTDRRQITAREIAEKHEEKLLMLGPVLERLHNELLDPLIDRVFNILQKNGVLPVPPRELANVDLKVDYVSVLAQAQQLMGIGALERVIGFAGQTATIWPEARHKIDPLQAVDDFADAVGINPRVVRSDEEVKQRVDAEAQAAARQAAMEQGQQLAETAATASDVDISEGTPVGTVMRNAGLL